MPEVTLSQIEEKLQSICNVKERDITPKDSLNNGNQKPQADSGCASARTSEEGRKEECELSMSAKISSLNFERVVNGYSIQATLDSLFSDNDNQREKHDHDDGAVLSHRFPEPHHRSDCDDTALVTTTMRGNRGWFQYTDQSATRWFLSAAVGLIVGLLAIAIVACTERIVAWRMKSLQHLSSRSSSPSSSSSSSSSSFHEYSTNEIFLMFAVGNVLLATLATLLCTCWVPNGAGSGIPQIMAYLNGVRVHFDCSGMDHFASFQLLLVKMVGTVLSVSSFLAIGMEGPLIHLGAIVGCGCTKTFSFLLSQGKFIQYRRGSRRKTRSTASDAKNETGTAPTKGKATPFAQYLPIAVDTPLAGTAASTTRSSCGGECCGCCCGRCCCAEQDPVTTAVDSCAAGFWTWITVDLSHFANDYERRDLVSIGASVGFAASFGAPIGGLLYVLDDLSSYLSKNIFFRTLVANAVGTFCLAWHSGSLSNYSVIDLGAFLESSSYLGSKSSTGGGGGSDNDGSRKETHGPFADRFIEVPLYLLVGIVGGIMGGIFCYVVNSLHQLRKRHTKDMSARKVSVLQVVEVVVLSLLTSTLLFYLPATINNTCKEVGEVHAAAEHARAKEPNTEHLFFCQQGEINEMSTLLLGSRSEAIKRILTQPSSFDSKNLLAIGILFYVLMTLTFGVSLPSGIFTPAVLTGASLGGVAGIKFREYIDEDITPSTFALLGVAALLAGVQRSTVSLCIILVEGTGQVELLIPVIITVVTARYSAELVNKQGIFEIVMDWEQFPFLSVEERPRYDAFQVKKLVQKPVITLQTKERAHRLVALLRESTHNGFPVVNNSGKLLGLVRRDQIVALIEFGVFYDDSEATDIEDAPSTPASKTRRSSSSEKSLPDSTLMHLAYHIKDDQYEFVENGNESTRTENTDKVGDMLICRRENTDSCRANEMSALLSAAKPAFHHDRVNSRPYTSNQAVTGSQISSEESSATSKIDDGQPTKVASVSKNSNCNIYISWLDPKCADKYINLAEVMNQGVYCVTEFCPISKARTLFTGLGLRHLVVMGGPSGGDVVGILTRASFLDVFIKQKTGA